MTASVSLKLDIINHSTMFHPCAVIHIPEISWLLFCWYFTIAIDSEYSFFQWRLLTHSLYDSRLITIDPVTILHVFLLEDYGIAPLTQCIFPKGYPAWFNLEFCIFFQLYQKNLSGVLSFKIYLVDSFLSLKFQLSFYFLWKNPFLIQWIADPVNASKSPCFSTYHVHCHCQAPVITEAVLYLWL